MKKKLCILVLLLATSMMLGQTLDVLSYNIRFDNPKDGLNSWDNRKTFLISQTNFYAPDIFGTQEGLINQLKDIEDGMENYTFFGVGRDKGDEAGEHTAIFYNSQKVELLKEGTFWLSKTPEKPSKAWDAALPRICTYGEFKLKNSDTQFLVFNAHFDHVGEVARKESAKLILKKIKELNPKGYPVILMGDFNLEVDSEPIQSILKQLDDTHLLAGSKAHGPKGTFNGFNFTKPVTRRIDYIFISRENIEVIKSAILSDSKDARYPSDHLPVYAKLKFEDE